MKARLFACMLLLCGSGEARLLQDDASPHIRLQGMERFQNRGRIKLRSGGAPLQLIRSDIGRALSCPSTDRDKLRMSVPFISKKLFQGTSIIWARCEEGRIFYSD